MKCLLIELIIIRFRFLPNRSSIFLWFIMLTFNFFRNFVEFSDLGFAYWVKYQLIELMIIPFSVIAKSKHYSLFVRYADL